MQLKKQAVSCKKKKDLYESFLKKGITSQKLESFIKEKFDHTVITPGTEFMDRLSKALKCYIISRTNDHP